MEEGLTPLLDSLYNGSYIIREGKEILERGFAPLLPTLPFPLLRGRG